MTQLPLLPMPALPILKQADLKFDGATYEPQQDKARLTGQLWRVYQVMQDGRWRTLMDLRATIFERFEVVDTDPAISARLRDLRKVKFGGYTVERRRVHGGLFEYRVL